MMYASPIEIKREAQEITETADIVIPDEDFTVETFTAFINGYGQGAKFSFWTNAEEGMTADILLSVKTTRLETPEEVATRVERQEKYMEGYRAHHAKYSRK